MAQRRMIPAYGGYDIAVATEQMQDGNWAAVATVTQSTGTAQRNIDLPVPKERFATEADAENFAVRMAGVDREEYSIRTLRGSRPSVATSPLS
jgi:hypothetical protein